MTQNDGEGSGDLPGLEPLPERLEPFAAFQRSRKDDLVARTTQDENDDLLPGVEIWRNGVYIAAILPQQIDKNLGLQAAYVGMTGFGGDEIYMTLDSHYTENRINPLTGKEWEQGEMQTACDNENACALGLITDTLWMVHKTRAGITEFVNLRYHVHKTARTVRWQDTQYYPPAIGDQMTGHIPDSLNDIFSQPILTERFKEVPEYAEISEGMDPEIKQAHEDCAVVKILASQGFQTMLYFEAGTVRAAIIEDSMGRLQQDVDAMLAAKERAKGLLSRLMRGDNVAEDTRAAFDRALARKR